jgi:uncharacterized membrane protein YtjA (UPF0391 family)
MRSVGSGLAVARIYIVLVASPGGETRSQRAPIFTMNGDSPMLGMAITFAILALIAGILGFMGLAGSLAMIAKVLLFVFLALFVISLIFGRRWGPAVWSSMGWSSPSCGCPDTNHS